MSSRLLYCKQWTFTFLHFYRFTCGMIVEQILVLPPQSNHSLPLHKTPSKSIHNFSTMDRSYTKTSAGQHAEWWIGGGSNLWRRRTPLTTRRSWSTDGRNDGRLCFAFPSFPGATDFEHCTARRLRGFVNDLVYCTRPGLTVVQPAARCLSY